MPTSRSTPRNHIDLDALILDLWAKTRSGQIFASKAVAESFARNKGLSGQDREIIVETLYGMLGHARRIEHALKAGRPHRPGDGENGQIPETDGHACIRPFPRKATEPADNDYDSDFPVRPAPEAQALLMTYRILTGKLTVGQAKLSPSNIDWPAVVAADEALGSEPDPLKRIGIRASLPDFLAERLIAEYGDAAEALALALNEQPPLMMRVNTIKASREKILGQFNKAGLAARPAQFAETGIELESRGNIFRLKQFAEGQIELQDEGSQLVCLLVAPPPKGLVVDYCAGAGGKTLALSALMKNAGRLIALDVHDKRLDELRRRARRARVANTRAILLDRQERQEPNDRDRQDARATAEQRSLPETGAEDPLLAPRSSPDDGGSREPIAAVIWPEALQALTGKADRVLVDVPCSGIGAFRRKPEMRWRLKEEDLRHLPEEQLAIARRAMRLCAPGGRLIYATCTLLAEENERVVEALLKESGFELMPVKLILGKTLAEPITDPSGTFLKLLPNRHRCDGFFAAVLRRPK